MFGAPDLPRPKKKTVPPARRPGFGDHVDLCGCYVGLIVDINERGRAIVASRADGKQITESAFAVSCLTVSSSVPLGFDERIDPNWKRAA